MLEREAGKAAGCFHAGLTLIHNSDSELDHSSSSSNAKPKEKSDGGETSPVLEEEWDDWDDELDADGEADEEWLDPGDAVSNESSVTLSSSSSSKRGHDEVDPEEGELDSRTPQSSPGMFQIYVTMFTLLTSSFVEKRPRIH
jgi:hypothetical protein